MYRNVHYIFTSVMCWGSGVSYHLMSWPTHKCWNLPHLLVMFIYLSYKGVKCLKFVLSLGGGFCGRLLIDLFCRSDVNYWKNNCVKIGKSPEGLLMLISLMRPWDWFYNTSTDINYCAIVVVLNMCWINVNNNFNTNSIFLLCYNANIINYM